MKKIIALLLVTIIMIGMFAGCSANKNDKTEPTDNATTAPKVDATEDAGTTPTVDNTDATDDTETTEPSEGTGSNELGMSNICATLYSIIEDNPMPFSTMVMDVDFSNTQASTAYTGLENMDDIKAAAACEAMMDIQAYSVVLVQVKDKTKVNEIAQKMYDGVDPCKWVQVEADDLKVAATGDLIILVMMDTEYAEECTAQDVIDTFANKCGELSITIKD